MFVKYIPSCDMQTTPQVYWIFTSICKQYKTKSWLSKT